MRSAYILLGTVAVIGTLFSGPAMAQGSAPTSVSAKPASAETIARLAAFEKTLPTGDARDWALAERGFIATVADGKLRDAEGNAVSELNSATFFGQKAPASVNPSLWRNAQLLAKHGLFKVSERVYQIRGFSLSNITIIEGDTGYIVVDPGSEAAAITGLKLVYEKLGKRPVTGIVYTHSHGDHYAGVRGVISDEEAARRNVPVIAPAGFIDEILGETIIAGPAMQRRAGFQFGRQLPLSETGGVTAGIGPILERAKDAPAEKRVAQSADQRHRLPIAPTHEISKTGETLTIDGVRFEFQLAPESEAPAEFHFYLPDLKVLCLAENANGTLHNALPARGALVRDVKGWADVLTEAISLYGDRTDVLVTSHFWPHWGKTEIVDYLANHRDAYKYLHDQSVRLMNNGLTGPEIADTLRYPDALAAQWYNREYYGTLSHNSRAVYQRYMGFYDGNPANLNPLPRAEAARHYIEALGGGDRVLALAKAASATGDDRWAVELLNRLVFAEPSNIVAKQTLADVYEQLGYQAESSTWRNGYLVAATELRQGVGKAEHGPAFAGLGGLPIDLFLDAISVRLVPDRAKNVALAFTLVDPVGDESQIIQVRNAVLIHQRSTHTPKAGERVIRLNNEQFYQALVGAQVAGLSTADQALIRQFAGLFDGPLARFPIVTP